MVPGTPPPKGQKPKKKSRTKTIVVTREELEQGVPVPTGKKTKLVVERPKPPPFSA